MNLVAVKRIFNATTAAEDAQLDQYVAENQHMKKILEKYAEPDALLKDAIAYGQTDTVSAWKRLVEICPELQAGDSVIEDP